MKKFRLLILTALLVLPISVFAASTPRVLTLTAKANDNTIDYNGTIEPGAYAVMCKLYNSSNEEVDLLSSQVSDEKFNGKFENVAAGKYTVACSRYEGGEVKKAEVIIESKANPKTYDAGILGSIILVVICATGIVGATIYLKKVKTKKQ